MQDCLLVCIKMCNGRGIPCLLILVLVISWHASVTAPLGGVLHLALSTNIVAFVWIGCKDIIFNSAASRCTGVPPTGNNDNVKWTGFCASESGRPSILPVRLILMGDWCDCFATTT